MAVSEYHPSRVEQGKGPMVLSADGTTSRRIPNYLHTLDDYLGAGTRAGFALTSKSEWTYRDAGVLGRHPASEGETVPQLISLVFGKA